MNLFDLEVYEKKKSVPSARKKKNGSKSKKCKLSTDGMTERQLQKRNGVCMTYQLNRPMQWAEFKAMPIDVQEKYLLELKSKFGITPTAVSRMFGVTGQSVINLLAKEEYSVQLCKGQSMTKEQKWAFEAFMKGKTQKEEVTVNETENLTASVEDAPQVVNAEPHPFQMSEFSISMNGKFNREAFFRSLAMMIPDGVEVNMEIKCTFNK